MSERNLAIFDFDYTLINVNSMNYLNKLVIERESTSFNRTPSIADTNKFRYGNEIENENDPSDITIRMNLVLDYMKSKHNIGQKDMEQCLGTLIINESIKDLLRLLNDRNYSLAIVSNSNKFVINSILAKNELLELFDNGDKVLANDACFDSSGKLVVTPLSRRLNRDGFHFSCSNQHCRKNICKGKVVEYLIETLLKGGFKRGSVLYVGDGLIDYCAGLKLSESDYFFVKKNSPLSRMLENSGTEVKACLKYWKNGSELLSEIQKLA